MQVNHQTKTPELQLWGFNLILIIAKPFISYEDYYKVTPFIVTYYIGNYNTIDAVGDIVPAVKPQMAFFEVFGAEGVQVHQQVVQYAHAKGLVVIDDSKRNDIGNTAKAYAYAHLAKDGPINADFMTVSPFLGTDSIRPFIDMAIKDEKGIFLLVKTSNPSSVEISKATNAQGEKIRNWLASYIHTSGNDCIGKYNFLKL